ncbi:hypothetical protein EV702DRAFT_1281083 [Suillus placidus]|uniref:Uncharacterized protein n=1 Tax=Suillus placidus TaxID=48579 RepID=A0A9P6ZN56_9AGAM|nr:hypothetical protein EV702DRAFT_1281083 [Suillus placidus]
MTWQNILDELKKVALTVSNQGPASESILGVKHLTLQHSADHWEELHAPVHAIFGWGQEGGLLSSKSSQADFLLIHDFLNTFAHVEQDVGVLPVLAIGPLRSSSSQPCRASKIIVIPGIMTRNVNDISPLAIGSYVIMQRSQGRYLGQVVCMYKKNGGGKGTRHESVLLADSKDVPSLTNIGLRVFIQTHPEENENSFWHHSKSTGHLWTLASIKELVYNLGTSALNVSEGRYHAMKPWAFERWEAAGMVAVREILVSQFAVRSHKKQNRRFA